MLVALPSKLWDGLTNAAFRTRRDQKMLLLFQA